MMHIPWTEREDEIIRAGIRGHLSWERITQNLPGRTSRTARLRADRLGIRPVRKPKEEVPCPIEGSRELLERMEAAFLRFSREHRVDYLDARTLLMNATGLGTYPQGIPLAVLPPQGA